MSRDREPVRGFEERRDNGCDKIEKVVVVEKSREALESLQRVAALSQKK